ncbi:eukaryotic translation initiation factor 4 gamma 1-like [Mya arenaria]|uniref:eukaryotic translation initiation factor 4 gamma 1-like n=1 Tax=Mya arenaria TaxID=6604 RepID=UPI0022E33B6F|nr:eukaryotic translation initiation factor 4 gamma 1-like [Mya arenaria]
MKQQQIDSIAKKNLQSTLYVTTENSRPEIATLKQTLNEASRKPMGQMYEFQKNENLILTETLFGKVEDLQNKQPLMTYDGGAENTAPQSDTVPQVGEQKSFISRQMQELPFKEKLVKVQRTAMLFNAMFEYLMLVLQWFADMPHVRHMPVPGSFRYVLATKWFKQWKSYVGYDSWENYNAGDESANPGPIDNSPLLKMGTKTLKKHLIDDLNYTLVPFEAWTALVSWYSITDNQSRGMPSQPSQKNKSGQPSGQINQPTRATEVKLHKAKEPWKPRRFKRGTSKKEVAGNDDAAEDLYQETECLLDRLTAEQFQEFESQMKALKIDTEDKMKVVVDLVYEKAMSEPNISVAYAYMCKCLSMIQVQSKQGKVINFRAVLLTRCQREFEMNNSSNPAFVTKHNEISKHENKRTIKELKKELRYEEAKTKQRSLGNIRFMGELFKVKMFNERIMHDCVFTLLRAKDPESLACVCMLLTTIGKELDTDNAKPRMDQYFQQIAKLANKKTTSARVRFMLQDMINIRLNKWIPRRSNININIIDQIHREVIQERQEQALPTQQFKEQLKFQKGDRSSPTFGQIVVGGSSQVHRLNMVGKQTALSSVNRSKDPPRINISKENGHKAGRFAGTGENSTGGNSIRARMKIAKSRTPAERSEEYFGRRIPRKSPTIGEGRDRVGFGRPPRLKTRLSQEQLNEDFDITKDGHSAPAPDIPLTEIADRLHDLIVVRREDNETIYNWI